MDLCFWFSTLSSLSLNHFPPNHPSFPPLINNNSPHTPHEHAGNAANDNTLALFLFTTPHHHFTRPSLPSHSPPHSSSLLTHCVQPLPTMYLTMSCKYILSCNSHTTAPLPLSILSTSSFIPLMFQFITSSITCKTPSAVPRKYTEKQHEGVTMTMSVLKDA